MLLTSKKNYFRRTFYSLSFIVIASIFFKILRHSYSIPFFFIFLQVIRYFDYGITGIFALEVLVKVSGIHLYPCNKPKIKPFQRLLIMPSTSNRPPQLVVPCSNNSHGSHAWFAQWHITVRSKRKLRTSYSYWKEKNTTQQNCYRFKIEQSLRQFT